MKETAADGSGLFFGGLYAHPPGGGKHKNITQKIITNFANKP